MTLPRLSTLNSTLLVVDVQDKLLAVMPDAPGLIRDVGFLLDVANLLNVPTRVTEQYPQGLGPTNAELVKRLPGDRPTKSAFSCCGAPGLLSDLRQLGRPNIVVVGMEAHVCILQTVLDLLAEELTVFVPVNAVQSRFRIDQDTALRRLARSGAILTTVEATAFEWLGGSDHPQFRAVSKLVRERMKALVA
ncbi:MAG TPA: isochorismatase family protein [Gemmataceae bacterium]|jgi:nicotinamidase-related amidase|nr:isochorismatase family protein [Gemmataceae bacterium]